jgi:hypothetical protein
VHVWRWEVSCGGTSHTIYSDHGAVCVCGGDLGMNAKVRRVRVEGTGTGRGAGARGTAYSKQMHKGLVC